MAEGVRAMASGNKRQALWASYTCSEHATGQSSQMHSAADPFEAKGRDAMEKPPPPLRGRQPMPRHRPPDAPPSGRPSTREDAKGVQAARITLRKNSIAHHSFLSWVGSL